MFSTFRSREARLSEGGGFETDEESEDTAPPTDDGTEAIADVGAGRRRKSVARVLTFGVLPVALLLLATAAGFLKWQVVSTQAELKASNESVRAASAGTVALLTYEPASVDTDLVAARENLTGSFLDAFTTLTDDVVIPGAKQQRIFSTAAVSAAAPISATAHHAVVIVFVNQTTTVADDPPTETASSVKVTLDNVDGRWLISDFAPL
ncbi:hypothetical protein [Mycolicibacterium hippocampi]|uniref:Outer membrane protein n=1 Tax=Mycolicibacterium hippocampi TaxID=659824 RepID=A0A7I9ZG64_9MYCO|nr:hypothetical protein [Mycolicibacterium hippocampi]GFG99828.1 outer membrane protein [Mycolicibacterium hippocampi]